MRRLLFTLCFAPALLCACLSTDESSSDVEATTEELGALTPAQSQALCPATARDRASTAVRVLQKNWFSSGNWSNTDWWHQANLLESISNYAGYSHDQTYNSAIDPFFWHENVFGLLFSQSYDDAQWVALGWLRADDIAPNSSYRDRGKTFYNYAASAWDTSKCGGGVWWSGAHDYKNAITNELFIVSSMKMYEKTHDASYLANAKKAWTWFASSGMINANGLINDGLNNSTCKNNGQTVWTYNQGVILGGLAMLGNATGDGSYVDRGAKIIDAVLRSSLVTSDGILKESCEGTSQGCNKDQYMFKGIFVRYLGYFLTQSHRPDLVTKYRPFLAANVDAIWNRARSSDTFDNRWTGPFGGANAQTQGSALDALNSALELADASFCQ